jgi:hypothetical protein
VTSSRNVCKRVACDKAAKAARASVSFIYPDYRINRTGARLSGLDQRERSMPGLFSAPYWLRQIMCYGQTVTTPIVAVNVAIYKGRASRRGDLESWPRPLKRKITAHQKTNRS